MPRWFRMVTRWRFRRSTPVLYEVMTKKGGKNTVTARIAVAADGKTRVTIQTGRDAQGRTVNNTIFYEKQ
jgi:hypothetical protein